MDDVRRAGGPPPAGEYTPIWRALDRDRLKVTVLSKVPWAYWTHWINGRTVPCRSKDDDLCSCPHKGEPQKWVGFLAVLNEVGKFGYLEVTGAQARQMEDQTVKEGHLRGTVFAFYRSSGKKGSRAYAERLPYVDRADDELPADKDPISLLLKLWNAPGRYMRRGA